MPAATIRGVAHVPGAGPSDVRAQEPDRIPAQQVPADDLTPELDSLFDEFRETIRDSMTVHEVQGLSIAVGDRTERRAEVLRKDGYLQLRSEGLEPLVEHEPGLFFGAESGEALDFRDDPRTWRNIELKKVR